MHAIPSPRDLKYFIFNTPWGKPPPKKYGPCTSLAAVAAAALPRKRLDEALTDWPERLSALPGSVPAHLAAPVSAPGSLFSARCFLLLSVVLSSEGSRVVPRRHGLSRGNLSLPSAVSYHGVNTAVCLSAVGLRGESCVYVTASVRKNAARRQILTPVVSVCLDLCC